MNKLIVLNGIQGSGKTTLGEFVSQKHGFKFVKIDHFYENIPRVDTSVEWFEDMQYRANVYDAFEQLVGHSLKEGNVIIESTGLDKRFPPFINNLESKGIIMLKFFLKVNEQTARQRVNERNKTPYPIKVTEDSLNYVISKVNNLDISDYVILDANKSIEEMYAEVRPHII